MRIFVLAAVFALAVPAVAQTPATGVPEAPVGHRQPTAADVPGNDSAKGGGPTGGPARTDTDRKVDKLINVCPSC